MVKHYVVVLPNGTEVFKDAPDFCNGQSICDEVVQNSDYTTARRNPLPIKVKLFALEIKVGNMIRRRVGEYTITPRIEPMIHQEYVEEMKTILADIPEEFHGFVENHAYDHGHSSGYEEVVMLARSMVYNLAPCINKFEKRVLNLMPCL